MNKNIVLKAMSWIGVICVVIAMVMNNDFTGYFIELAGFVYALLYAYNMAKNKLILVIATIMFLMIYSFVNPSALDFITWLVIGICLFDKRK